MNSGLFWQPGQYATLRGVKAKVFWAYPTIVVQDTPDWIALYMPAGVLGKDTAHKPTSQEMLSIDRIQITDYQWKRTDVLFLIVPGDAFSTYVMWETGTQKLDCWYVNLQEPIRRTCIGFDTMDHILDVVISPDMSEWRWKDEIEFAEAYKAGVYSQQKATDIRKAGETAIRLITSERRAIYEAWAKWRPKPEWRLPILSPLWHQVTLTENSLHTQE